MGKYASDPGAHDQPFRKDHQPDDYQLQGPVEKPMGWSGLGVLGFVGVCVIRVSKTSAVLCRACNVDFFWGGPSFVKGGHVPWYEANHAKGPSSRMLRRSM